MTPQPSDQCDLENLLEFLNELTSEVLWLAKAQDGEVIFHDSLEGSDVYVYLHAELSYKKAAQALESVNGFLTGSESEGVTPINTPITSSPSFKLKHLKTCP